MRTWRRAFVAVLASLGLMAGAVLTAPSAAAQSPQELRAAAAAIQEVTADDGLLTPCVDLVARVVAVSSPRALQRLADNGDAGAQALMGSALEFGVSGFNYDEAQAARYYERAAIQGNVLAQYNLGGMYFDGRGVVQDYGLATSWRELAAEQGDRMAMRILGYQYMAGHGVGRDYQLARGYLEPAAALGDGPAALMLGAIYEEGLGVAPDLRRAVAYYRLASDLGEPDGQAALSRLAK